MDLTSAESKATYAKNKDYVLKEHGVKFSNLYISQVKRNLERLKESIISECIRGLQLYQR